MRIIVVTSWFLSLNRPYISPYLLEFINRLTRSGLEVSLYVPRPSGLIPFKSPNKVRIKRAIGPFGVGAFISELLLSREQVVHVQRPNTYTSVFIVIAKLLNRPVVVTIHRAEVLSYHPYPWGFLRSFILRIVDRAICVSESTRQLAIGLGCPARKAIVIYNAVDEQRFRPRATREAREALGFSRRDFIILFVGDFRKEKGCDSILQAVAKLDIPFQVLLVGDGPLRSELEDLANSLGISQKVTFTGRLPHASEKLPLCYNASDIFALPSHTEGHSMALLEALASGVPVIATRVGGNLETVDEGEDGFLVSPNDDLGFRDAIRELLTDSGLRHKMGIKARERIVEKFSEKEQISKTMAIYTSLTEQST